jgi:DNA-binding NarL/FixJ family response regulator
MADASASRNDQPALTCLVADDHPAILDAISRFLGSGTEIDVVGLAADGAEAFAKIEALRPDVALIDVAMPQLNGVEIARRLLEDGVETGVILYSGHGERALVLEALDAGARGFVLKGGPLSDLPRAVRIVAGGGTFVDAELAGILTRAEPPTQLRNLTQREREVLRLLAHGMRNDEVAQRLSISPLTVGTHVKHVMEKLQADTRTEAVAKALRQSLIL